MAYNFKRNDTQSWVDAEWRPDEARAVAGVKREAKALAQHILKKSGEGRKRTARLEQE